MTDTLPGNDLQQAARYAAELLASVRRWQLFYQERARAHTAGEQREIQDRFLAGIEQLAPERLLLAAIVAGLVQEFPGLDADLITLAHTPQESLAAQTVLNVENIFLAGHAAALLIIGLALKFFPFPRLHTQPDGELLYRGVLEMLRRVGALDATRQAEAETLWRQAPLDLLALTPEQLVQLMA